MKREKFLTALCALALAFLLAWSALGCLISAFDLVVEAPEQLLAVCLTGGVLSALLLSIPHGSLVLICLLALAGGYVYRDGRALDAFQQLMHTLTTVYNRAYGWGVMPEAAGAAPDRALAILGLLIIVPVCESVCRRRSAFVPVLATLVPLGACVVVTDTVPAEHWLLLVLTGLILLVLPSAVRRENPGHGLRLTAGAALPVVLALVVLFRMVPQEGYVNHSELLRENLLIAARKLPQVVETGGQELTAAIRSAAPRQVDLSTLGQRIPFTYPVMEVTSSHSGSLYLRRQDYDQYDGMRWTASADRQEAFPVPSGPERTVTIHTSTGQDTLYLPYYPADPPVLRDGRAENPEKAKDYTLTLATLPDTWRQTAYEKGTAQPEELQSCLALPEATRQAAAPHLEHLYAADASNTAKAEIIAAMVLDSAEYDLDPARMPEGEGDFALWFLREADRGYCVHFATAATVLLRAAGIPARYVSGYLVEAEAGRPVTVTEEDAHAWAEYYEPNLGLWLPLEATPAQEAAPDRPMMQQPSPEPTVPTEPAPTEPETTRPTEPEMTRAPDQPTVPSAPELPEAPEKDPLPLWLLLIPAVPLMLVFQRWSRLFWRQRQYRRGTPNRQALRRWWEAERLSRLLKESPPAELQELALKAKFSQYTLTGEEISRFDEYLAECIRRMHKSPWWRQLVYRFVYAVY